MRPAEQDPAVPVDEELSEGLVDTLDATQLQRALAIQQAFAQERIKVPGEEIVSVLRILPDNEQNEDIVKQQIREIVSDRAKVFHFVLEPLRTQISVLRQQNAQMWQDNVNLTKENAQLRQQLQAASNPSS